MVHFVGAGCGAADLITLRGKELIEKADVIIYAGSLVNPELLSWKKEECPVYNSAKMTLEEVIEVMLDAESKGLDTVRLHTGDPCLYGAIREQMDVLDEHGITYDYCPGVSSLCGAAAAINMEYTLPDVSQSVVITRMAGRTPVPERESLRSFAAHKTTMVLFLSASLNLLQADMMRTLLSPSYTKLHGRMRKHSAAPSAPWQNAQERIRSPRQRLSSWAMQSNRATTDVQICTIRISPPVTGKLRGNNHAA